MRDGVRGCLALLAAVAGCGAAQAQSSDDTLIAAIRAGDVAAARSALARHGADADRRLAFQATPLAWAVDTQNPEMVRLLLATGAKPDAADADGVTPLALACELGDAGIVTQLLAARASGRAARPDGATPLAICARYGPPGAVATMLADGVAADTGDARGQTPLMWAAASGRIEAMALLLKAGADVNRVSKAGFTPLFFAIKSGVAPATAMLLTAGASADFRGPEHTSALQLALYQNNVAAAALLVKNADMAERDREGEQPLHRAAAAGDTALIAKLLARGADPNGLTGPSRIKWVTEANFGMAPPPVPPTPPLLLAAANGHAAAVGQLLAAGASPRFVAADGTNVLLAAARSGSSATLDLALRVAPVVDVADGNGLTALQRLIVGGPKPELEAMMRILAAHGARTDIKNRFGGTAVTMAADALSEVQAIYAKIFPDRAGMTLADARQKPLPRN